MNSMRNRMVILALAITVILGLLACSTTGGLIARNDPTATPTKTPKPTFTITPTPTDTPIPTDTPTPTATFTPTPEATNTPIVLTATPTFTPTNTPAPTNTAVPPTATRRPATRVPPTATKAPPTNTPKPQFAWNGVVSNQMQNCGLTRVFGFTLANNGALAGDIWVHYWADGWDGDWAKSQWTDFGAGTSWKGDEGNWDGTIDVHARDGVWHTCVTEQDNSWTCISNTVDVRTSSDCVTGHQVFHVTFRKN